jgi:hypothetical protein
MRRESGSIMGAMKRNNAVSDIAEFWTEVLSHESPV